MDSQLSSKFSKIWPEQNVPLLKQGCEKNDHLFPVCIMNCRKWNLKMKPPRGWMSLVCAGGLRQTQKSHWYYRNEMSFYWSNGMKKMRTFSHSIDLYKLPPLPLTMRYVLSARAQRWKKISLNIVLSILIFETFNKEGLWIRVKLLNWYPSTAMTVQIETC